MNKVHFSSANSEWTTPPALFEKLNGLYHFTLDACATKENALCDMFYTKEDSCLLHKPRFQRIFINPPYCDPESPCKKNCKKKGCIDRGYHISAYVPGVRDFVKWAWEMGEENTVIALLPARTDTKWFHSYIYNKAKITFFPGRLKFGGAKNSAPFPSMIVDFTRL